MATFIGEDRSGRVVTLIDDWADYLPITAQEAELLRSVRHVQDMRRRRASTPDWNPSDEEQIELGVKIALNAVLAF